MNAHSGLFHKHCKPSGKIKKALSQRQVKEYMTAIPEWKVKAKGTCIRRKWVVKDFLTALDFFQRLGRIAEAEDHHPDLYLKGFRNVAVELSTHDLEGLTVNDFILAAKIDHLHVELQK